MSEIVVTGTMQEIVGKLNLLMEVVKNRQATGWPALMGDENWQYMTMGDEKVCPVCAALDGTVVPGSDVVAKFPFYEMIENTVILPHVHLNCRCHLEWPDAAQICEERLHEEKLMSVR